MTFYCRMDAAGSLQECFSQCSECAAPKYATIVADPPWDQMGGPLTGREGFGDAKGPSKPLPYKSMTVDAIKALRVATVAQANSHLYLWTTNAYLRDAFDVAKAWGFKFSTLLTWAKNPMGGGLGGDAYGISTEFILFCRRGSLPAMRRQSTTWFNWKRSYDERGKPRHSAKPGEFFAMVDQVSPGPYLEMFARDRRLGWDSWGNEVNGVDLPLEAA